MSDLPSFEFNEDEIAAIKASLGVADVDETQEAPVSEIRAKRKPGRPKGSTNRPVYQEAEPESKNIFAPAPLTKREEKDVAIRLANILTGATGMAGMVKPYLPMTDEEAEAIAIPLASYLIRNEPTSGLAREILENYDLIAVGLGTGAYVVRVYSDRKSEVKERAPINTTVTQRVGTAQVSDNGRGPDEGIGVEVSIPNASRSGSTPFDL